MKTTINPKDEFANRHKKYHIRFDDNEKYKAWLNDYIMNHYRIPIVPDRCKYKQEAESGNVNYFVEKNTMDNCEFCKYGYLCILINN